MTDKPRPITVSFYLVVLVLMIIAAPFIELIPYGRIIESVFMTLVFLSAALATGAGHKTLLGIAALAAVAITGKWMHYFRPELVHPPIYQLMGIFIIGFTAYRLLSFIVRSPKVDGEVLCAGVATYLTLGLLWALIYVLVDQLAPGSFSYMGKLITQHSMVGFTALYFSFATLCTVGFGDILPVSGVARMLAVMEAGVGIFYVAILISRLVSLHASGSLIRSRNDKDDPDRE